MPSHDPRTDQTGDHRPSGEITFTRTGMFDLKKLSEAGGYDPHEEITGPSPRGPFRYTMGTAEDEGAT